MSSALSSDFTRENTLLPAHFCTARLGPSFRTYMTHQSSFYFNTLQFLKLRIYRFWNLPYGIRNRRLRRTLSRSMASPANPRRSTTSFSARTFPARGHFATHLAAPRASFGATTFPPSPSTLSKTPPSQLHPPTPLLTPTQAPRRMSFKQPPKAPQIPG